MVDSIKITALQDIGANIAYTTLVPLVNMAGTPTTQKANLQILGNLILNGAGGSYFPRVAQANLALSVANAAQPNITSVGTLTSLTVTGNIAAGNINGGNIVVANFYYGDGGFLTNVVANGSYSNSNVANYLPTFTGNVGAGNVNVTGTVYANGISSTGLASLTTLTVSATANLGAVGNVKITGGNVGQLLATDGNGNLSWVNDPSGVYNNNNVANYLPTFTGTVGANRISSNTLSGSNLEISANGAVFTFGQGGALYWPTPSDQQRVIETNGDGEFEIKSTTNVVISTDTSNVNAHFTFDSEGIFTAPSNVNLLGTRLNVGPDAATVGNLLNPTLVIASTSGSYIQAALINNDGGGSADWSADGAGGGDLEAWTDMGFAGFSFNDANFTITEPGDGYLFVQAYANGLGGNMVLATGDHSNTADIIFATGGFLANNEFARIDHANDVFHLTRAGSGIKYPDGSIQTTAGGGAGGLPLANGNSNFNIANANGNATVTTAGTQTWIFGTDGNLTIPNDIISNTTIEIDNRASGNSADINLYSADDILLQARDRATGSTSEGGDINIFAGDSAEDSDTSAGDIIIEAGRGGASNIDYGGTGGFVSVSAGQGGNAVGANFAARPGGSLTLNAGDAGTNNGNIDLGNTGGDVTINAGDTTSNGDPGGSIILRSGDAGANALAGQIQLIISGGDVGPGGTWIFDGEGIIQLPNSGTIGNDGNNIDIGSSNAISLEAASAVNIYTDTGTAAWQWQFQDDGNLRLPTIELDVGNTINEQTVIQSQRKVIPGLRYSAEINGTTPTVVYTATSIDTTSMKVAMQIQHTGLGFEFFDVSATSTGGDTFYTVSNRLHPPGITDSTVVVDLNGSNTMDITVTINSGAANSWVTYDATEFGIAVD
jgi:hypothetical protein